MVDWEWELLLLLHRHVAKNVRMRFHFHRLFTWLLCIIHHQLSIATKSTCFLNLLHIYLFIIQDQWRQSRTFTKLQNHFQSLALHGDKQKAEKNSFLNMFFFYSQTISMIHFQRLSIIVIICISNESRIRAQWITCSFQFESRKSS